VLVNTDEPDEAAKHLERAVQREPNNAVYHLWLGRAYGLQAQRAGVLRQAGLARRTKGTFERVLALDPANLDARVHLIDFHLVAPGLMGGSKQTALQFAQEIRQRNEWLGLFQLARVQLAMDQRAAAEQTMHTIIRTYPDSASARVQLALYYSNLNRFDYAYETLRPFASGPTANRPVMYQMGRLAAVSGQYLDEGEAALRTWLRGPRQPGDLAQPAGHWRLGMILEHRGDTAGARREYEAALAIDPEYASARDALRRLR
jgi:tetratricopeptide (TPR) repeat protein